MTNLEKLRTLSAEELYDYLDCPKKIVPNMNCISNKSCKDCISGWLNQEVEELKPEPKKPSVPGPIDRLNFEKQIESLSIKAFVQQFKYLACKINEIIKYMEETEDES